MHTHFNSLVYNQSANLPIQVYMNSAVMICYLNSMKNGNASKLRKGAWGSDEDTLLRKCIEKYGEGKWHLVPQRAGLNRCRKSCRLRWLNYLRPTIKRGEFSADEVDLMIRLHKLLGNRWSLIGGRLPGRTANDVKNHWNTNILKKLTTASYLQKEVVKREEQDMSNIGKTSTSGTATIVIKPLPRTLSKGTSLPSYNLKLKNHMNFGSEEALPPNHDDIKTVPPTLSECTSLPSYNLKLKNHMNFGSEEALPPNHYDIKTVPPTDDGIEWWKNLFAEIDIHDQEQNSSEGLLMSSSSSGLENLQDGERGLIWKTDESTDPGTETKSCLEDGMSDIWDFLNSSDDN